MTFASAATPMAYLYVTDLARARAFYTGPLGLTVQAGSGDDYGEVWELGGALLRVTVMPDHAASAHPVLGWQVADMDAAAKALAGHGIAFIVYDGMGQDELGVWTSDDGKSRMAWFADPDGNVLMLTQD